MTAGDEKTQQQVQVMIPEEFALRDEVRWLKSEDIGLFQFIRDSMNRIEPAYVATYPPSECGIATFTKDVATSVAKYTPFSKPCIVAIRREQEIEPYERVVRAGHLRERGQTLVAEAFYDPPTEMLDKDLRGNVSAAYGFAAQGVLLDVEEETGRVRVRRVVSAHDAGRVLNPPAAEGQVHGGIHMGLGYALAERLVVRDGQVLTASFMDYALLRADDMPEIVVRFVESADAEGPFGAKGLGESGTIPVSAAVANALKDALGLRFTELPITPATVRAALEARR